MRSFKLLIILGIALFILGIGLTQITAGESIRTIKFNYVKLTDLNSTWSIDLGLLPKDTRILPTLIASPAVNFMVMRSDTKELLRDLHNNWDRINQTNISWTAGHGWENVKYQAPETASYNVIIIAWQKPTRVEVLEVILSEPPKFPFLVPGYVSLGAGVAVIILGLVKRKKG